MIQMEIFSTGFRGTMGYPYCKTNPNVLKFAGCQWFSTFSTMLAITQVGAAGDIPDSPEVVPAAADGAKSIMKAKVTRVHEEKSLVHLLTDVGDSRVVNLKSFTELWPMPPLCLGFC